MATPGMQITYQKRLALADCTGLLQRASEELDLLVRRGRERGLDIYEVEDLAPLTRRVVALRERRARLEEELYAVSSEWTT
jgi:hypothetical protein